MKILLLALAMLIPTYLPFVAAQYTNQTMDNENDTNPAHDPNWIAKHLDNMTLKALEKVGILDLMQDLDYDRVRHADLYTQGSDDFRECIDSEVSERGKISGYDIMDCSEDDYPEDDNESKSTMGYSFHP